MQLEYTYTEEPDGWLVGYLNIYPEHKTQGKDVEELELMLADLYEMLKVSEARYAELERQEKARQRTGKININAEVLA
ncbi:MAG: hypothetical protein LBQ86_03580 [Holophagales bacterium]|jgi:hypothetical protein|nr:hypothetical protein [Holophagales bacterium]